MQFRLRALLFAIAAIAILIVPVEFMLRGPRSVLLGYDHSMQTAFEQTKVGESKQELLERFGEPWSTETWFSRTIGYRESDFSSADLEKCVQYVTWINGGNWFYCFGFDENDRIVLKADGHS